MTWLQWLVIVGGALLAGYAAFLVWLARNGRREDARAVVGFIPDCVVLFRRLLGDDRVPRSTKALVVVLISWPCRSTSCPTSSRWPVSLTMRSSPRSYSAGYCVRVAPTCCESIGGGPTASLDLLLRAAGQSVPAG